MFSLHTTMICNGVLPVKWFKGFDNNQSRKNIKLNERVIVTNAPLNLQKVYIMNATNTHTKHT